MFELFDPSSDFVIRKGANLPHWFQPGVTYFITFRTEDSIPASIQKSWYAARSDWLERHGISNYNLQFSKLSTKLQKEFHQRFSLQYMESLDKGYGACPLACRQINSIVAESLFHFDTIRYHLGDFVIMPNHVHLMVCLKGETRIEAQCASWKRFSARKINLSLNRTGRFWQEESFDHLIRSSPQFAAIQRYIANNPRQLNPEQYYLYQRQGEDTSETPRI